MHLQLDAEAARWQAIARRFADEELKPWEVEAEMSGGRIPDAERARHQRMAIELGFSAMSVPREHGGLGLPNSVQVAVWEQLGRITNGLSWCFAEPQGWMFEACNRDQIERYVLPLMRGERHDCYAITESGPGSEVAIETKARRCPGGYRIDGEKWYVTSANFADYFVLQAALVDGEAAGTHALFFVEADSPGIEIVRTPPFSHTYAAHHPTYRFNDVFVPEANRIGDEGAGMGYMHTWFRRERLMIAARCCGAAARLIEDATAFASARTVGGEPLVQQQAMQMMLADCVAELWAARLITFETAAAHDRGEDLKHLHTRCSIAKLYASEMANRVADRAVQIFGGRGYMRENVAERFYRELRVERIWEGTSEIQRLIIARGLIRRGLDEM